MIFTPLHSQLLPVCCHSGDMRIGYNAVIIPLPPRMVASRASTPPGPPIDRISFGRFQDQSRTTLSSQEQRHRDHRTHRTKNGKKGGNGDAVGASHQCTVRYSTSTPTSTCVIQCRPSFSLRNGEFLPIIAQ